MSDPRYPIGPFNPPAIGTATAAWRSQAIDTIAAAPGHFRKAVDGLTDAQLDTPYRPGGWTVRQVVHHVPDSHLNAYVRLKLALTEDAPTIKPYDEALWAQSPEVASVPISVSLSLLDDLHVRWVALMRLMKDADFSRRYNHPETGQHDLNYLLAMYSWHGRHHEAHITELRKTKGW